MLSGSATPMLTWSCHSFVLDDFGEIPGKQWFSCWPRGSARVQPQGNEGAQGGSDCTMYYGRYFRCSADTRVKEVRVDSSHVAVDIILEDIDGWKRLLEIVIWFKVGI